MIIVGVVVFPIGIWSQLDSVSLAEEAEVTSQSKVELKTEQEAEQSLQSAESHSEVASQQAVQQSETPGDSSVSSSSTASDSPAPDSSESTRSLPTLPSPELNADRSDPGTRTMNVIVFVSGQVISREIAVPVSGAAVRHAIDAMNLKMSKLDRIFPALDAPLYGGLKIRITRVRAEIRKRSVALESSLRFRPTSALRPGQQKIEAAGQNGVMEVSERIWFKDGQETTRQAMANKTIRAAKDKVIAIGARPYYMPGKIPYHNRYASAYSLAARAGSPRDLIQSQETKSLRPIKSIVLTATGYSPDPRENGGYTTTATGLPISYGAAAVDPRVIPLGTKMYVEGYGYAFACDTGGAIKGNRIDLAYDSYRLANTKGRKKVKVWILAP